MVKRLRADGVSQFTFRRGADEVRVVPLRGHFMNLDYPEALRRWDATDLRELIDADPVPKVTMPGVVAALRAAAADQGEVVVATDFDREGELIGAEAVEVVREVRPRIAAQRARFSALTRPDIESAFGALSALDENLAASARTREAIDLMWGSVLTRFLSLAIGRASGEILSAGRVQTPTLAILGDRERERESFVPRPFWDVIADLDAGGTPIEGRLTRGRLWRRDEAEAAQGLAVLATEASVATVATVTREERPPVPLHTTRLLALADQRGLSPHRAMTAAESLYHDGRISYPRTDNTAYPPTLGLRRLVENLRESDLAAEADLVLGLEHLHPTRGRATSDHPPVHPTAGARKGQLSAAEWTVYEIVARHFLATVSRSARLSLSTADLVVGEVPFRAEGERVEDPGWRAVVGVASEPRPDLPPLSVGDRIEVRAVRVRAGQTAAPPRYTAGMLIQEMERLGLGTKSTRHEIVQKLFWREYARGKRMRISGRGRAVVEALEAYAPKAASSDFTRDLEADLDGIARGDLTAAEVLAKSRAGLREVLADLEAHREGLARWIRESIHLETDYGPCGVCGTGRMVVRRGRGGHRFLGCSRFPECRNTRGVSDEGLSFRVPASAPSTPEPWAPTA